MQPNTLPNQVALYARVSSEEQREGQTIDSQIAELERFAVQSNWKVTGIYKDEGWSGGVLDRPALDHLRDNACKGLFQIVLINDVDRLARDVSHLGVIKRDLERRGVQVVFRKLPVEKSPTQNLMVNILGSFAEFERELILDRTRRGRRHKVETRKQFIGCIAPYGFRYSLKNRASGSDGALEINAEEAAIVRRMYSWVDGEGLSSRQVLDRLDREGICPRKGSTNWAKSSVLRILRSEVYAGVWYYNKHESCEPLRPFRKATKYRPVKTGRRLRTRSEWFPVELPGHLRIIARSEWERVQRQIDKNRTFSPRNSKHMYLLTGLIRCGSCGRRYVGDPGHGHFSYRCLGRCKKVPMIAERTLNEIVWAALKEAILNPDLMIESITKLNRSRLALADNGKQELDELERALQQLQTEEGRILDAYRLNVISAAQLGSELEKLRARRSPLEARKLSLENTAPKVSMHDMAHSVSDYCSKIANEFEDLDSEAKRRIIRILINEIVFDGRSARIMGVIPVGSDSVEGDAPQQLAPKQINHNGPDWRGIETTQIASYGRNTALEFEISTAIIRKHQAASRIAS